MNMIVQTNNLCKKYGSHFAVQDISINVPKGQIYGLLGRNGAGKTTIMKLLLGLIKVVVEQRYAEGLKGLERYSQMGLALMAEYLRKLTVNC